MQRIADTLAQNGFALLHDAFTLGTIETLRAALDPLTTNDARGGIRNLLQDCTAVRELAYSAVLLDLTEAALDHPAFPVKATLFDKTGDSNWLVPWHQDLTICTRERIETPGYAPWTRKAGIWNVQPPPQILEGMVAVRIHLDDCGAENGALRVLPGTHRTGRLTADEIEERQSRIQPVTCAIGAGGILLMKLLLLHASSQATQPSRRRVIHIDYASTPLGGDLEWCRADSPDLVPLKIQ